MVKHNLKNKVETFNMDFKKAAMNAAEKTYYMSDSCENHPYIGYFWPNFPNLRSKSHDSYVFGTYREKIDFIYQLLISFLRVIRPSDCDLKYHFGPKMLEYGRKKLYLLRFLQLVIVTNSPLCGLFFVGQQSKC
jgi:replication-associated recombination protein RarA